MATNEHVTRLIDEVAQTRGQVASIAAFVRGVPDLVRAAVQEALAANPGLNPEDLAAITSAADELDAAQSEILAAMESTRPASPTPTEPSVPTEPTPATPEPAPTPGFPEANAVMDGGEFASSADRNVGDDRTRL
jgi:hypothetical protein